MCFLLFVCLSGLENGGPFIDQVLVLQNYAEGWTDGKWEEKVDERPCIEKFQYSKDKQGYYRWGSTGELHNTTALFVCIYILLL